MVGDSTLWEERNRGGTSLKKGNASRKRQAPLGHRYAVLHSEQGTQSILSLFMLTSATAKEP